MTSLTNSPVNAWQEFLVQQGAHFSDEPMAQLITFSQASHPFETNQDFVAPLTDFGVIAATGEEAAHFLHNQLSNDIEHLDAAVARLAGYCSPKGRLLATILCWRSKDDTKDEILLLLPRSILAAVQKRLQMFILRAKVKLRDASSELVALGLGGALANEAINPYFTELPAKAHDKKETGNGTLIRMPDAHGTPRLLWVTHSEKAIEAWPLLTQTLRPAAPAVWRLAEIKAGTPWITPKTQEQFVPQMVNFELIGGVNFKKGCYPGQEIVARSQYLGKLKRRMLSAMIDVQEAEPGMEVFSSADPDQPCGMIVNAEQGAPNQMACLVEIKVEAAERGSVHLGSAEGPKLAFVPLPYALPDPAP